MAISIILALFEQARSSVGRSRSNAAAATRISE